MAGISTGVSLLTVSVDPTLVAWFDMDSGTTYLNKVKPSQLINSVSGLQTTTNQINSNLASYHTETFTSSSGTTSRNLNYTTDPINVSNSFSVSFWVKNTGVISFSVDNYLGILQIDTDIRIVLRSSGLASLFANGAYRSDTGSTIGSTWRFLTFIFRNTSSNNYVVDIYDNGSFVSTSSSFIYSFSTNTVYSFSYKNFGVTNVSGAPNLSVDSLAIYNKVLSPSEITFLYNSGNGRTYADL